jgi:hypothetical protein
MEPLNPFAESDALHARVRAMIRSFDRREAPPESFDAIAAALVRFQSARVAGYRHLCAAYGVDPTSIEFARQAPAVPTDAFRMADVFAFDAHVAAVTFRTSGTTLGVRGVHRMRKVETYETAALSFGRATLFSDLATPVAVLVVGPSPAEAPDSSLTHMCALFARALGVPEPPERTFFVRGGKLDVRALRKRIAGLARSTPAIVLATSFALVHLIDAVGSEVLRLPSRSRVMQTGGFKGRSREVDRGELEAAVARAFAVDRRAVICEYGMTELSSQFWEAAPVKEEPRVYVEPPWARVVPVDGQTLAPVPDGSVGIARIEDLANVDSAFAILTQDRVRRRAGGFELLGRTPGAAPRGCSIALEEMLSASQGDT